MRDPAEYDDERLCPCRMGGYPVCAESKPDGTRWSHDETCRRYRTADALCEQCAGVDNSHS